MVLILYNYLIGTSKNIKNSNTHVCRRTGIFFKKNAILIFDHSYLMNHIILYINIIQYLINILTINIIQ